MLILRVITVSLALTAHDPAHPVANSWLSDLYTPFGGTCCDDKDVITDPVWDIVDGHYRVFLNDVWQVVPDNAVIDPHKNRDGIARLWVVRMFERQRLLLRCFLPGSMT